MANKSSNIIRLCVCLIGLGKTPMPLFLLWNGNSSNGYRRWKPQKCLATRARMMQTTPPAIWLIFCHFAIYTNTDGTPTASFLFRQRTRTPKRKYHADKSLVFVAPFAKRQQRTHIHRTPIIIGGCCLIAPRDHSINWKLADSMDFE